MSGYPMVLEFGELKFSAAHYIPGHPTCGGIHGHTYFIRGLVMDITTWPMDEVGLTIDFGKIKKYFKEVWDHKFIVPKKDQKFWEHIYSSTGYCPVRNNLLVLKHTTAEHMAAKIRADLMNISDGCDVHFTLCEGPAQGVGV